MRGDAGRNRWIEGDAKLLPERDLVVRGPREHGVKDRNCLLPGRERHLSE
jgi:hypothetical protein